MTVAAVAGPMPSFILECPQCLTRFHLMRYEPDHRVRCRKCSAIVRVPLVAEHMTPEQKAQHFPENAALKPEIEAKLAKRFSIRRLLLTAGALVAALAVAVGVLFLKASSRELRQHIETRASVVTFDGLLQSAPTSLVPIGKAAEWSYQCGDRGEDRRVTSSSMSADYLPVFEISTGSGSREAWKYATDGVYLVELIRGGERLKLEPPVRLAKLPLLGDDSWDYEGQLVQPGGRSQPWKLSFRTALDVAEVPAGKFRCVKVVIGGTRAGDPFHEELWYAPGAGIVRRISGPPDKLEDWKLTRYAIK